MTCGLDRACGSNAPPPGLPRRSDDWPAWTICLLGLIATQSSPRRDEPGGGGGVSAFLLLADQSSLRRAKPGGGVLLQRTLRFLKHFTAEEMTSNLVQLEQFK